MDILKPVLLLFFYIIFRIMKTRIFSLLGLFSLIAGSLLTVHADDLQSISLDYCATTGNVLHYTLETDTETGICYTLTNTSDHQVTVKVNFIDGTFTNDQRQNKACLEESTKENFGQYVTDYQELVTLTGGESKTQIAKLRYPKLSDGRYHGCITYSIIST